MLPILPLFLIVGLFLPGFFLAKCLRHEMWWASAFVMSLLVLFHIVFWLGIFHISITLWTVLPCLIAASAGAAWLARGSTIRVKTAGAPPLAMQARILILSSGSVGAVLLACSAISPLNGYDTRWRWDFLAQRLLVLGRFDFYPPLTAADFRMYCNVDAIPPLVSFTQWWLYAAAGRYLPQLICVFVAAQFVCTLAFTYGAASALFSRRAGVLAAAILAGCPLFFRSVVLGQETGLTALAIAAMIYFVVTAKQPDDISAMVSAGLAAALCALLREYGWVAIVAGVIALVWRRQPLKQVVVFAAVATAVAGPWYARTWILSGNPFYGLSFGNFAVNPIADGLLRYYNVLLGVRQLTIRAWAGLLLLFLFFATLQVLAGIPGGLKRLRQHGYLTVIALLFSAVWIQSIGYTSGGVEISTRVLSPVWVVLSITGAGILEPLTRRAWWHAALVAAILLCQIWTAAQGVFYPDNPLSLPLVQWRQRAFQRVKPPVEFQIRDQVSKVFPPGSRILSDGPYLHAALIEKGIEVVPIWSPEVRFLFSSSPEESERQLRSLHVVSVTYCPISLSTDFMVAMSPFYASLTQRWRILAQVPGSLYFYVPKQR